MGKFLLSPQALEDIDLIWIHIAQDNPEAADRVLAATRRTCQMLADHPEVGRLRKFPVNTVDNIRSFVITEYPNYVIFYRHLQAAVQIVRVLHGAQNIEGLFGDSSD